MKKIFLIVIVILSFSYVANGQSNFGLKGGLNLANQVKTMSIPQVPTPPESTKPFIGYQLGVFYKTQLYNQFSISAETNFSVIGSSKILVASDGESYDTNEKLGYIELPLTLQYSINKLYLGLGPSVAFKLFSKLKNFENRTYGISKYQTMDAAGNILAGYNLANKIDVNLRYSHGLMNIYKDGGYAKTKNNFVNFSFLYFLK